MSPGPAPAGPSRSPKSEPASAPRAKKPPVPPARAPAPRAAAPAGPTTRARMQASFAGSRDGEPRAPLGAGREGPLGAGREAPPGAGRQGPLATTRARLERQANGRAAAPVAARAARSAAARGPASAGPGTGAGRAAPQAQPVVMVAPPLAVPEEQLESILLTEAVARGPPPGAGRAPVIQTKLAVSHPGDAFERQADAVAARVLSGAAPRPPARLGTPTSALARQSAPARAPPRPTARGPPAAAVSDLIAAPGPGRPLDPALRDRVEPHLGVDLGHVVVYDGPAAASAAGALRARAFTSGSAIFLGAGASASDLGLMAHEATHVAQQQAAPAAAGLLMRQAEEESFFPDVDISVEDLIPDWILDGVRSAVRSIPGYSLITYVTGYDPLSEGDVAVGTSELVEELLTYGPFGPAVATVLEGIEILSDVFGVITEGLAANNLTAARIGRDIDAAWDEFSVANGIAGNVAIVERYVGAFLADVGNFVSGIVDLIIELVRAAAAKALEPLLETPEIKPVWDLARKVLHYDPLRGEAVEASTVEILSDFLKLIGQDQRLAQMEERGTLQQTADWIDEQLATLAALVSDIGGLFEQAWEAIQPENLPNLLDNLATLATDAFGIVSRLVDFCATVIGKVLELIKDALLGWLSEHAHSIPGFHLLTVILEQNPFTGDPVPRTAENLIKGFITLLPGGEQTFEQLAESGVIADAAQQIETAMADLGISVDMITATFLGIWDSLSLDDLLDPIGAFGRVLAQFGEPLARLFDFIIVVIEVVVKLVLRLMNFPGELLGSIIGGVSAAIGDIQRDPVGFFMNLLSALKLGLEGFFNNFLGYLLQGLADWLFRGLGALGIQRPPDLTLESILQLVLQVLGISAEMLWSKLGEHIGPERVEQIRGAIDMLTGAWSFIQDVQANGVGAIWRFVSDQLGALWDTLLGMAQEWIMTTIVEKVTVKLLSMLDPTGIMAVVNSAIAFFNAVQSAMEYLTEILQIINQYVQTIAAIAAGNIGPGAAMLEAGLAGAIPIAIGFLANQVGLGNVPEKIVELIQRLRSLVEQAIDWLITQALNLGSAILAAITGRGRPGEPEAPPEQAPPEGPPVELTDEARAQLYADIDAALADQDIESPEAARRIASATLNQFAPRGLKSISIDPLEGHAGAFKVDAAASPGQTVATFKSKERINLRDILSRRSTTLIADFNGRSLGTHQSVGRSRTDHPGHAESFLLLWLTAEVRNYYRSGGPNVLDVRLTRSPCPVCRENIANRLALLRTEANIHIDLNLRVASVHGGHTEAGVDRFFAVAMLADEGIALTAWNIVEELDQIGLSEEDKQALRDDPESIAWLENRVAQVQRILDAIAAVQAEQRGGG